MKKNSLRLLSLIILSMFLSQCDGDNQRNPIYTAMTPEDRDAMKHPDRFFGDPLFSSKKKSSVSDNGMGVNAHLWRASLDTFSFMPLEKVEPFSGVIMTEWYKPPRTENERLKATIMVLNNQLRSDGVRVSLFHQVFDKQKGWVDVETDPETIEELERTILTRARQLKREESL